MLTISDGVLTEVMFDFIEAHLKECVAYALLFAVHVRVWLAMMTK